MQIQFHQNPPNDTYFDNQFYLHNTGQLFNSRENHSGTADADIDALEAWNITRGNSNITIAVLDQGVTSDHYDLPNSRQVRLDGSNFGDGDANDPSPTASQDHNHGNACAGIIAATQNNNEGLTGIAPSCKIMPIRIFKSDDSGITAEKLATAIDFAWQNGADAMSNSWGIRYADNPNHHLGIRDAIQRAINNGCVVVFAAGNTAKHHENKDGYVMFPSNVEVEGVLTVGASDRNDEQSNYSPTGDPGSNKNQIIDVVAPSHRAWPTRISGETLEVFSIDIPDSSGYNIFPKRPFSPPDSGEVYPDAGPNHLAYTGRFGGTSAACPQVAAVAALILSVDPGFTPLEVFDIITQTADDVGAYSNSNGISKELGHGRLNACKALMETIDRATYIIGNSTLCTSSNDYSLGKYPAESNLDVTWSVTPSHLFTDTTGSGSSFSTAWIGSGNGLGTITATLAGDCGSIDIHKSIWVGHPENYFDVSFDPNPVEELLSTTGAASSAGADSYLWDVTNGSLLFGQGTATVQIAAPYCDKYIWVGVTASNNCGEGYAISGLEVSCRDQSEVLTIYPNPSDNQFTVSVEDDGNQTRETGDVLQDTGEKVYVYYLYDLNYKLIMELSTKMKTVQIKTNDLAEGFYILHVVQGKKVYKAKIEVRH